MTKENCRKIVWWNYSYPRSVPEDSPYSSLTQTEWNVTLVTRINQCSAEIHMITNIAPATHIKMNSNIAKIIEDTLLFDERGYMFGKYEIVIDNGILDNIIFVYNDKMCGDKNYFGVEIIGY